MSKRLAGRHGYPPAPDNFKVTLRPDRLKQPLRWRKPRMVFVCSMGDLFHDDVPFEFFVEILNTIVQTKRHIYQILTKRPAKMLASVRAIEDMQYNRFDNLLPNIWLGVTVENQQTADERRAAFEQVPAATKFVSYEPALGSVDWSGWEFVQQIISGGETGPGARPSPRNCHRLTRSFCVQNQIAYHFKQHGEWLHFERKWGDSGAYYYADNGQRLAIADFVDKPHRVNGGYGIVRIGNKRAGHLLDGVEHREMPEVAK